MSAVKDLSIQTIIKKYENRQDKLLSDISKLKHDTIDTARHHQNHHQPIKKSGMSTPEFNYTINRKDINRNLEEINERTEKKQGNQDYESVSFRHSFSQDRNEYENILRKLDQTQDKLAKAERNYAEIWRKYERLQQEKEHSGKEVQLQQRLRQHEVGQFQQRVIALQRQNKNYKECISSKDSNIEILREKLKEKNERLIESERVIGELKSELATIKSERDRLKEGDNSKKKDKEDMLGKLKNQFDNLQKIADQREVEKKELLLQMEKNYKNHQEELEILKKSYLQVEEEYKEWIEQCNSQKLAIIKEYEAKLTEARNSVHQSHVMLKIQSGYEQQINKREQEINRLTTMHVKQSNQCRHLTQELQRAEKDRSQLILKISSVENQLIHRMELYQLLQTAHNKLNTQFKAQEGKTKQIREKYNSVNRQFIELRSKCTAVFSTLEQSKKGNQAESMEQIRLRKELMICREQLEKSKNNEYLLSQKLNQGIRTMKDRLVRLEEQKNETMTDLLAERLENARLKEEIKETKQYLKKEYQLSIENTRKELESQIGTDQKRGKYISTGKLQQKEKEELYLQLRGLQRKYELLVDEIVTVDEVMNIAAKVQRRHQNPRK